MGYRHPKKQLSTRDVPNPKLLRQQAQPAAEEVAGNLNEHNIQSGTLADNRYTSGMLYDFKYAQVDSDHHIASNPSNLPDGADADAFRVSDGGEWETITGATVTYTEGEHLAWAIGWCQYGVVPDGGGTFSRTANPTDKPRAQFALRINGTVIEETITGTERPDEGAPGGVRPIMVIQAPGTEHWQRSLDYSTARSTGSMSWHVKVVRVQCQIQVPQGSTTVELVVRRVIADGIGTFSDVADALYVWNRTLVDVIMKLGGTDTSSGQEVTLTYPEDADALNATTTATNLLTPLVTAANALNADAVRRAGLRNEHLPLRAVRDVQAQRLDTGTTTARVYPGWGNLGVVGAGDWQIVNNGAGSELVLNPDDGSGDWNFTTNPGFVLIFANIGFVRAQGSGATPERYGVFGIGTVNSDGTTALNQADQGFVNNPNVHTDWVLAGDPPQTGSYSDYCETDVPMFAFFDFRTVPPAKVVRQWRTLVSCENTAGVDWEKSSMFSIIFRP